MHSERLVQLQNFSVQLSEFPIRRIPSEKVFAGNSSMLRATDSLLHSELHGMRHGITAGIELQDKGAAR